MITQWCGKACARETEGIVKAYVSQISEKLRLSDRTEAALTAMRAGLVEGCSAN